MSADGPGPEGPATPSPWAGPGGPAPTTGWGQHGTWAQPGSQTSPWGQPFPGVAPDAAPAAPHRASPRRRRRGPIVVVLVLAAGLVVLAVGLTAAALGPRFRGTDVLDPAAVERGVAQVVTQDWKRSIDNVRCPADRPARAGTSFTCSATVDGRPQQVPVDVLDEHGLYQVGQPR